MSDIDDLPAFTDAEKAAYLKEHPYPSARIKAVLDVLATMQEDDITTKPKKAV